MSDNRESIQIFITGHMPGKGSLLEEDVPCVKDKLNNVLSDIKLKYRIEKLITSLCAGADLLALEWGIKNNICADVFVTNGSESDFIKYAVAYGDLKDIWLDIYYKVNTNKNITKHTLKEVTSGDELNNVMINMLTQNDLAVVVWDGKYSNRKGTEYALRLIQSRGINNYIIPVK